MPVPRSLYSHLLLLALAGVSCAQTFDYRAHSQNLISLDGKWRFHAGDDKRWADPNLDDSHWSLLRSDQLWGAQGYKGHAGFGWYRFHIGNSIPAQRSLLLPGFFNYYQIFVNGRFVGEVGKLPPHEVLATYWAVHPIPAAVSVPDLCIAIRVWVDSRWASYGGGPVDKGAVLGSSTLVNRLYQAHQSKLVSSNIYRAAFDLLKVLTILTTLSLFFFTGLREYEYLWYGLYEIFLLIESLSYLYVQFVPASYRVYQNAYLLGNVATIFEILFFARILEAPKNWLFWVVLARTTLVILASELDFESPTLDFCAMVVYYVWLFWATWRGARRGLLDARLVMVPLYLLCFSIALHRIDRLPGLPDSVAKIIDSLIRQYDLGPIQVNLGMLNGMLLLLAIWAILIARFVRTRREEQQHATQLAAARAVQHMLIPDETPAVPGFSIVSVYRPAHIVGGDFFQIIPAASGVLICIGDVSGKGLPAAMTVSLIVGTLRTLAEQTTYPAILLQGLNRRLIGRGTGFTTCLIAYLDFAGNSLIANAGHPSPYHNGEEFATLPNLPLGIVEDAVYEEVSLTLDPNDRLTFLSDGVLEAKNNKGELFGFARAQQTSTETADTIATTARQFGQEDDITVLTVEYQPVAVAT